MNFLNSGKGYTLFSYEAKKDSYVDKSMLIHAVYNYAQRTNRYICVTRPRRFGKSTAANMITAFYEKCNQERSCLLFNRLEIGSIKDEQMKMAELQPDAPLCWPLQGKCNVIRINMIELLTEDIDSWNKFMKALNRRMKEDLAEAWPDIQASDISIPEALEKTGAQFIFVIDEWDAVFEQRFMTKGDQEDYIQFLKGLLKDRAYIQFVYMTGILPVAKYSSGSPLNMFKEFTSFADEIFYPFFGLTEEEIRSLMNLRGYKKPSLEELSFWYEGYIRGGDGIHIYNPTSVSEALAEGTCKSHWTGTGPMNEVRDIIRHNVRDLRQDIIRMAGGETLEMKLSGFSVEQNRVSTKDEILSAMVVYGFLTYHDQRLRIPNHELALKFQETLASEVMGLNQTLVASKELLNATLLQENQKIANMMETLHDEKIPFFRYNDENSLACVVTVGYLAALDDYHISREDKAGKGFVDFCFTPIRKGLPPVILELKYNRSAKNAIQCIHEKEYILKYKDHPSVLLVGINYSARTKKHSCLTELVRI